jgi:GNAT superfamily N-acetyltransferase
VRPLRIFIFREGLVRVCTQKYKPLEKNMGDVRMHLTNYSINKDSEAFVQPAVHTWVAADEGAGGAVVGAICLVAGAGDAAEVNAFYVAGAHQQRGIGARLMDAALGHCRAAGVRAVRLTSNKGHYDPAIAFYGRRGFVQTREFEAAPGIVLVQMELALQ